MSSTESHSQRDSQHTHGDYNQGVQSVTSHIKAGLIRRGWRKMTWALIAWSTLIVTVAVVTTAEATNNITSQCHGGLGAVYGENCQQLAHQAGGAQFGHVMKIGVVGFLVLTAIWFMSRPKPDRSPVGD